MTRLPDELAIRDALEPATSDALERLAVFEEIDSTNSYLMSIPAAGPGRSLAALAGHQTQGRGRRQREWLSSPGASFCLSVGYTFGEPPEHLPALTLALGVAVSTRLRELGAVEAMLKWPNDIVAAGGKLGGILVEAQHRGRRDVSVVAGLGLNLELRDQLAPSIPSDWATSPVDLCSLVAPLPEPAVLAAAMIDALHGAMRDYEQFGFGKALAAWRRVDWLFGKAIEVDSRDGIVAGRAAGADADGALLIDTAHGRERIISGTVVARPGVESR